ncbi:DJ-1/PfpI family protein [Polyangium sorediatum]|uniref:DJ-1/PfpI family protein n=1 Tax=Polyangium sorediatum TaxID=889274 RepID=A0ABT6NZ61_9BACT|nr:DJ-1/PfpI family protein [Polyangium sorediatum]MDI1433642.1 DJ-1/PfpI family protein [Polyangium sorediatum]
MPERTIAFVVFPEITPLDLVGPLQVLQALEGLSDLRTVTVGERIEPVATDLPFRIVPARTFDEVPEPYGIIVPGGLLGPFHAMASDRLMGWLKRAASTASFVGSVCTGSLVLAALGLLEGKKATTHWSFLPHLARFGATPVKGRWVEDGNVITAAGVSAGIDMALALGARLTNESAAKTAQLILEYEPQPPFGPITWEGSAPLLQAMGGVVAQQLPTILREKPELLAKFAP